MEESYCDKWERELLERKCIDIAKSLIAGGETSYEGIAESTGLPIEKIYELAKDKAV